MKKLALGIVLSFAVAALSACADENDPATWAKRLGDQVHQTNAIERLSHFFEDAMSKSNNKLDSDEVKKVLDAAIEPMAKTYATATLDEKTRKVLIRSLGDMRDPRANVAYIKALGGYEAGKEDDAKAAAGAVKSWAVAGKPIDQGVKDALWECFSKLQPSKSPNKGPIDEVHAAVLAVKDPSYGPKAIEKLGVKVTDPRDQLWQATALRLIKELKYGAATDAVVKVLLNPAQGDLRGVANSVLMNMPKEGEASLLKAIRKEGAFKDLVESYPDKLGTVVLADSVSWISRPQAKEAILGLLAGASNDTEKTIFAQTLSRFVIDAKSTEAFVGGYKKITPGARTAQGLGASLSRPALLQVASLFFDSSLTPMILKEIQASKGDESLEMQAYGLESAIKLMDKKQIKDVEKVMKKYWNANEQQHFAAPSKLVEQCDTNVACYAKVLDEPLPPKNKAAELRATKATWMVGVYGKESDAKEILTRLDKRKEPGLRLLLVEVLDHLLPKGSNDAAATLEKMVEADTKSGDKVLAAGNDAVVKVAQRLRARAMP